MASTEKATQKAILELCQRPHIRLWRTNSGQSVIKTKGVRYAIHGAPKGTSDIIGWRGPQGTCVALEVKDEKWTPPPKPKPGASKSTVSKYETYVAQQAFIDDLNAAGGVAGFVLTVEEAMEILGLG